MDNQHREIPGYRELNADEIGVIQDVKAMESRVADFWRHIRDYPPGADLRFIALARTHLEEGFSYLVKAIAKPESPWDEKED